MGYVALFLLAKLVLYLGFYFLLSKVLDIGVPLDALRAAFHRTWTGGAATLACLVVYMGMRMSGADAESNALVGTALIWLLRAAVWTGVTVRVYKVTRWRKGKLAVIVLLGLALNFGVDYALVRLQGGGPALMPSFGDWNFRIC